MEKGKRYTQKRKSLKIIIIITLMEAINAETGKTKERLAQEMKKKKKVEHI